jgi:hypothetical protein
MCEDERVFAKRMEESKDEVCRGMQLCMGRGEARTPTRLDPRRRARAPD